MRIHFEWQVSSMAEGGIPHIEVTVWTAGHQEVAVWTVGQGNDCVLVASIWPVTDAVQQVLVLLSIMHCAVSDT